jgi:hypothetical protein
LALPNSQEYHSSITLPKNIFFYHSSKITTLLKLFLDFPNGTLVSIDNSIKRKQNRVITDPTKQNIRSKKLVLFLSIHPLKDPSPFLRLINENISILHATRKYLFRSSINQSHPQISLPIINQSITSTFAFFCL